MSTCGTDRVSYGHLILSPCHPVTLSPCHLVTRSPCHLVTLSACHLVILLLPSLAGAHPIPKSNHDRTVVVHLERGGAADQLLARVVYRLEVDPVTVILED